MVHSCGPNALSPWVKPLQSKLAFQVKAIQRFSTLHAMLLFVCYCFNQNVYFYSGARFFFFF